MQLKYDFFKLTTEILQCMRILNFFKFSNTGWATRGRIRFTFIIRNKTIHWITKQESAFAPETKSFTITSHVCTYQPHEYV